MSIKVKLTRTIARQALMVKAEAPTLLFVTGVASTLASTVFACKATLKLSEIMDEHDKTQAEIGTSVGKPLKGGGAYSSKDAENDERILRMKTGMKIAKAYAPAIILGIAGIAAFSGSRYLLNKRNAALAAAYAGLMQTFTEYRQAVANEIGVEKERELHYKVKQAVASEKNQDGSMSKTNKKTGDDEGSIYAVWFNAQTSLEWQREPEYTKSFLYLQQSYCNQQLNAKGYLFLNDVLKGLGLPKTRAGQCVGWVMSDDGSTDNFVDFGIFNGDSREYFDFVKDPQNGILLDFNVDGDILDRVHFKKR